MDAPGNRTQRTAATSKFAAPGFMGAHGTGLSLCFLLPLPSPVQTWIEQSRPKDQAQIWHVPPLTVWPCPPCWNSLGHRFWPSKEVCRNVRGTQSNLGVAGICWCPPFITAAQVDQEPPSSVVPGMGLALVSHLSPLPRTASSSVLSPLSTAATKGFVFALLYYLLQWSKQPLLVIRKRSLKILLKSTSILDFDR